MRGRRGYRTPESTVGLSLENHPVNRIVLLVSHLPRAPMLPTGTTAACTTIHGSLRGKERKESPLRWPYVAYVVLILSSLDLEQLLRELPGLDELLDYIDELLVSRLLNQLFAVGLFVGAAARPRRCLSGLRLILISLSTMLTVCVTVALAMPV